MLPARAKLTRSDQFKACMRSRAFSKGRYVIVYAQAAGSDFETHRPGRKIGDVVATSRGPALGLIVGKNVGNAVIRHGLSRKLRAIFFQASSDFSVSCSRTNFVIRALPQAADASFAELDADVNRQLQRAAAAAARRLSGGVARNA